MSTETKLFLGGAQFGLSYGINNTNGQPALDSITEMLNLAWNNGIREIDTAQDYGNSEEVLSLSLKKVKKNFKVHSKFTLRKLSIQEAIDYSVDK